MKPSLTKNNPYAPYLLLLIQPIFMATNTIVARGGVESVPPISLAFWRWFTVFIMLLPFFYNEILKNKKEFNKYIEYRAQPNAAPKTHKSPIVKLKLIKKFKLPLDIIVKTPAIQINKPNILKKLIFSLKNKIDKKIIITGEDV